MRTIAVAIHKGGTGKTTTTVNMAVLFARKHNKRVLVIDLDAQSNASEWLTGRQGQEGKTTYEILQEQSSIENSVLRDCFGVDIVPANLRLASIDIDMAHGLYRENRLKNALLSVEDSYDYCFIDCPPNLGIATVNAFAACDAVIIPIECKGEAFQAIVLLMAHLRRVTQHRSDVRPYALPTFLERTNIAKQVHEEIISKFQALCLPPINKNTRIPEAYIARQPLLTYDPQASGTLDYLRAAKELINDLEAVEAWKRSKQSIR